jgi:hypothetical protein
MTFWFSKSKEHIAGLIVIYLLSFSFLVLYCYHIGLWPHDLRKFHGYCLVLIESYALKLKWLNLTSILFVSHINLLSFQFQLENIDSKIKSLKLYNLIASHNKTLQIEPLRQWPFKSSVQVSWIFHNYFSMYGTILRLIIRVLTWSSTRKILEVDAHGWDIYLISVSWTKTTINKYAC